MSNTQQPAPVTSTVDVSLDTPIRRGDKEITTITLIKPNAGALRGLSLVSVANMEVQSLIKLLPRISSPTLTEPEVTAMDPADLSSLGMEVAGFLVPKKLRTDFQ